MLADPSNKPRNHKLDNPPVLELRDQKVITSLNFAENILGLLKLVSALKPLSYWQIVKN